MEPVIQYARTADGVNIACSAIGEGPPLVVLPILPLSHLQVEWQLPGMREFLEAFAANYRVVRFDARGLGLSDRGESDRSLDAYLLDLEAVLERLGIDRFAMFSASYSGPIAIRYAARHPERVSRLLLWCTHAYHADVVTRLPLQANQQRLAVNQLAGVDRDLFIRTYLHRAVGWREGETANRFVDIAKQSIDPGSFFENLANHAAFDARDDLAGVQAPTIVMHRPGFVGSNVDVAKGLAARMKNARLSLFEGESVVPFIGDTAAVLDAALAFLAEDATPSSASIGEASIRTILFTDMENHTAMVQRLGDARARDVLREHERVTREALHEHGGEEIRSMGDGFLASFHSTQLALRCAIDLQRTFNTLPPTHGEPIRIRVGINAGEPISDGDALYGNSVVTASELAAAAEGGQILVSLVVRELVAGKGFHFQPVNQTDPTASQRYQVVWQEAVAL
jgi:pimeloyl-ACP methyl ester carboxylesterase/class 3 adenylate cyclase